MDKENTISLVENWGSEENSVVNMEISVPTEPEPEAVEVETESSKVDKTKKFDINKSNSSYIIKECTEFDKMGLNDNLLRGIYGVGFERPSSIQQRSIVPLMDGRDMIAQSQSGTGKTGSFTIGSLNSIDLSRHETQVLVLAPTRELASQIHGVYNDLSKYMKGIDISLVMGGMKNLSSYDAKLRSHVIVGTPGRVFDYLRRGIISNESIKLFILDEADEMLSQGFKEQIYTIFKFVPSSSQVVLFSATIPEEVLDLTKRFMNNPLKLLVKREELTLEGISQYYIGMNRDNDKFMVLCSLYRDIEVTQCIIYCNSVKKAHWLSKSLEENDFTVSMLVGEMAQSERKRILDSFKSGETRVLLTTNLLARGIDIQQVSLVINYDIPFRKETYIHRIGRSGRFGRKGTAINFVTKYDVERLREIEEFYATEIEELPENIGELICQI
jgi:superfamily II DNA/RNA helicase